MEYYLEYILIAALVVCILYNLLPSKKEGYNSEKKHRFVNYNAEWCYYSKQLNWLDDEKTKPGAWRQLMEHEKVKEVKNVLEIVDLKCDKNNDNEDECKTQGIEAYPTIILHKKDGSIKEYRQDRDLKSFIKFLEEELQLKLSN